MRPLFMADPRNLAYRSEEQAFLLGGDLMVVPRWAKAPVLPDWREISLIPGDLGDAHQASLRIRPGAIVPLGKVVQSTTEESLDPLTLLVSLDARGKAEGWLYEDAGDGFGFLKGDYLLTRYRAQLRNGKLKIHVASSLGRRPRPKRRVVIEVLGGGGVERIEGRTGL
jgi:alpha-glucosidase